MVDITNKVNIIFKNMTMAIFINIKVNSNEKRGFFITGVSSTAVSSTGVSSTGVSSTGISSTGLSSINLEKIIIEECINNKVIINLTVVVIVISIFIYFDKDLNSSINPNNIMGLSNKFAKLIVTIAII